MPVIKFRQFQFLFYQDAFRTPGIRPWFAISRNVTRESPKVLIYPRGLPVNLHLLCKRTGEAFLGSFCKPSQSPASLRALRLAAYLATILCLLRSRAFIDSLAIFLNSF